MFTQEFLDNNFDFTLVQVAEVNEEPSLTVQGEDFSVKDLVRRFANGTLPEVTHDGMYDDSESFDNILSSDMSVFDAFEAIEAFETAKMKYIDEQKKKRLQAEEKALFERLAKKYGQNESQDVLLSHKEDPVTEVKP